MDKLEIALEKSRQQRAAALSAPPAQVRAVAIDESDTSTAPDFDPKTFNKARLDKSRIVAHHTRSPEADVYRQLRTQVLQIMNKSGFRTLAITSPHYGDGKTTVSLNLGISIALDLKQTVLLVDLDLRKPNLHQYMGVKPEAGLTDYLINNKPLNECLMRPPFKRMNILPAGSALDHSSELLGSPKMIALASEMKARYPDRLIIYDMPPVLKQDDPIAFLPQVDAVLVVVRDGVTRVNDLKRCMNTLAGANVIGTILNDYW